MALKKNAIKVGNIKIHAKHAILEDVVRIMVNEIDASDFGSFNADIYFGVHEWSRFEVYGTSFRIGVQTEQLFDEEGMPLWGNESLYMNNINYYDLILDLSISNIKYYSTGHNVVYGPYIFPDQKFEYKNGIGGLLFVGALNDRREKLLRVINGVVFASGRLSEINDDLNKCSAVLNLHFEDGRYTEWPRLLLAYSHGKPVVSEPLCSLMTEGRHYFSLKEIEEKINGNAIFDNFKNEIAINYMFSDFLRKAELLAQGYSLSGSRVVGFIIGFIYNEFGVYRGRIIFNRLKSKVRSRAIIFLKGIYFGATVRNND